MLKYIWRDKKQLIIIIGVILVCSIAIAIGIYVGSIKCIGTLFHQKKELILKKEQKENDK